MFSPGMKRSNLSSRKERNLGPPVPASPITPVAHNSIANRPSTGTPAPWATRLSVLARTSPVNKSETGNDVKPVYVGEFPQVVRDEQACLLGKHIPGDACISGGMDKETCLSWIICGNKLFIWNYLSPVASKNCIVLELPSIALEDGHISGTSYHSSSWLVSVVNWDSPRRESSKVVHSCISAGLVMCNTRTRTVFYWPDIYDRGGSMPTVTMLSPDESEVTSSPINGKSTANRQRQLSRPMSFVGSSSLNSLIASAVLAGQHVCVALACGSNDEMWKFYCTPNGVQCSKVNLSSLDSDNGQFGGSKGYPRSLVWRFSHCSPEDSSRQFFLLTDHEIHCLSLTFHPDLDISKVWSHEIVGTDGDLGIKKDLAGQKRIWALDLQVDGYGKVITVLVATFCKDRVSSSNYTQYSLLTMQYKSGGNAASDMHERVLEKKAPIQVIVPKARVEDEDFLFSMRLRVGGKPLGSVVILSGDGTATVSHYYANSTRLYQFDLPYDAGKVLDVSVLPSTDDGEDGAWVVLTEKAGIWTIPEKAVVLGGVEPPERSLSRKGSSNERSGQEERRNLTFAGNIAPRRVSSEAWDSADRQRTAMAGFTRRSIHDEESEALLGQLFHDFLLTEQVDGSFEKLQHSGAFERDGETSVFSRISKSIIDTLPKHWTTTRGAEILAMTHNQLMDKQQKHEKFLQFLALSKCHEELCSKQRQSLQTILEHGEKLAGVIQLRELQNIISQNRSKTAGSMHFSSETQISGALWDLIQLIGEKARRNTVLLMDRDNAEVFYSKVSDLEEVFCCLDKHLKYIISEEQPVEAQVQKSCELADAIVSIIRNALLYRDEHHMWYPPPEGLTPWYSQSLVRNGMWKVASFMLQLLKDTSGLDISAKSEVYTHLEMLTEVILEAYAGAITAKVDRGEEHKVLLDEYWKWRDSLLESLYQLAKDLVEGGRQVLNLGANESDEECLRKLSSTLLSIAKTHEAYNTMWTICCDLNDSLLLRNLMHDSMGPKGGFSYFVFEQLYKKRQFSRLLRLGEEFQDELSIFLKQHRGLLWLHELFLHQFSSASETLHGLALSQDEISLSEGEEVEDPEPTIWIATLSDRKCLLNLSKIATMAGKCADYETKMSRIEADLKLLKLQEEIVKCLPADEGQEYDGQRLLRPEELIELCLKAENPELALRAFDAFAWSSSSFRRSHRNLLEECWKNAVDLDDWGQLYQASKDEGWSDEETLRQLRHTVLFQASSRCYGPQGETIEDGFEEVFPLRKHDSEVSAVKDSNYSVEAVLIQHKDFPDAGKLMLTAVMLGSASEQNDIEPRES
ncbi:hypothetical protein Tsubulata_048013 [Turnera subulata]|uniref:Nucleoporin Nup133/Nup155-like N-terminal domain-containing protein n=1 Tax=Turnera subulata TaxID=218843 RepID=A0A9Q0FX67_9ROSI|nr:hypothetical protein Tsubulata_048013 [Turnera subulata]